MGGGGGRRDPATSRRPASIWQAGTTASAERHGRGRWRPGRRGRGSPALLHVDCDVNMVTDCSADLSTCSAAALDALESCMHALGPDCRSYEATHGAWTCFQQAAATRACGGRLRVLAPFGSPWRNMLGRLRTESCRSSRGRPVKQSRGRSWRSATTTAACERGIVQGRPMPRRVLMRPWPWATGRSRGVLHRSSQADDEASYYGKAAIVLLQSGQRAPAASGEHARLARLRRGRAPAAPRAR